MRESKFSKRKGRSTITTLSKRIQVSLKILQIASHLKEDPLTSANGQLVILRESLVQIDGTMKYYKEGTMSKCFPLLVREEEEEEEEKGSDTSEESDNGKSKNDSGELERDKVDKKKEEEERGNKVATKRILKPSKSSVNLDTTFKQKLQHKTSLPNLPFSSFPHTLPHPLPPPLSTVIESHYIPPLPAIDHHNITNTFPFNDTSLPSILNEQPMSIPVLTSHHISPLSNLDSNNDDSSALFSSQSISADTSFPSVFPIFHTLPPHSTTVAATPSLIQNITSLMGEVGEVNILVPYQLTPTLTKSPEEGEGNNESLFLSISSSTNISNTLTGATNTNTVTYSSSKLHPTSAVTTTQASTCRAMNDTKMTITAKMNTIYSSSVVSNSILESCQSSLLLPLELKLQVLAKDRYTRLLETMQCARSLMIEKREDVEQKKEEKVMENELEKIQDSVNELEKEYKEKGNKHTCTLTLKSLLNIFDSLFASHLSYPLFHLPTFLQLWVNIGNTAVKGISKWAITSSKAPPLNLLLSHMTVSLLIDTLLLKEETRMDYSLTLFPSIFSLLHLHVKLGQEVHVCGTKKNVHCSILGFDGVQLRHLLLEYLMIDAIEGGGGVGECDVVFAKFLFRVAQLEISYSVEDKMIEEGEEEEREERGVDMLLAILVEILNKKR